MVAGLGAEEPSFVSKRSARPAIGRNAMLAQGGEKAGGRAPLCSSRTRLSTLQMRAIGCSGPAGNSEQFGKTFLARRRRPPPPQARKRSVSAKSKFLPSMFGGRILGRWGDITASRDGPQKRPPVERGRRIVLQNTPALPCRRYKSRGPPKIAVSQGVLHGCLCLLVSLNVRFFMPVQPVPKLLAGSGPIIHTVEAVPDPFLDVAAI
jgi:hypothetical protein